MYKQRKEFGRENVASEDVTEEVGRNDQEIANLVGFFDVLIQMDIEQKLNKKANESD